VRSGALRRRRRGRRRPVRSRWRWGAGRWPRRRRRPRRRGHRVAWARHHVIAGAQVELSAGGGHGLQKVWLAPELACCVHAPVRRSELHVAIAAAKALFVIHLLLRSHALRREHRLGADVALLPSATEPGKRAGAAGQRTVSAAERTCLIARLVHCCSPRLTRKDIGTRSWGGSPWPRVALAVRVAAVAQEVLADN